MARSFSQANTIVHHLLHRRGYAVASDVSVRGGLETITSRSGMMQQRKGEDKNNVSLNASSAWAPDPVTGYYRPISHVNEIEPAELRNMLLNHPKSRSSTPSSSS